MIAESFERIHRSNLVGMGVLPLQFTGGTTRADLELDGTETFDILGIAEGLKPRQELVLTITPRRRQPPGRDRCSAASIRWTRSNTSSNGGILQYVLRSMVKAA